MSIMDLKNERAFNPGIQKLINCYDMAVQSNFEQFLPNFMI